MKELEHIDLNDVTLEGLLSLPPDAKGLVLFAHGSGSSRHSPRNNFVAQVLCDHGFGTLLTDLLTSEEDEDTAARFDIRLLSERLVGVTRWVRHHAFTKHLTIVPGATHLFEELGTLEAVARHATQWFTQHLRIKH